MSGKGAFDERGPSFFDLQLFLSKFHKEKKHCLNYLGFNIIGTLKIILKLITLDTFKVASYNFL